MGTVVCIGSLNLDLVLRVDRMPAVGETVTGHALERHLGGKGLNQAIAAARSGGQVALIGAVGDDEAAQWMRQELAADGIDDSGVATVEGSSGTALIEVDSSGDNRIVVVGGANAWLTAEYTVAEVRRYAGASVALAPLEVTPSAVVGALGAAQDLGLTTILNTAPVPPEGIPEPLFTSVDIMVANEHEAALISGMPVEDVEGGVSAGRALCERGIGTVVVTLGPAGCIWVTPDSFGHVPAFPVTPIDTVAAGDAFCGVLAASLADGRDWTACLLRANAAGALATTVAGAAPSLPTGIAIDELCERNP